MPEGFVTADLAEAYLRYAHSGVGLVVIEPTYVLPPHDRLAAHIGLCADAQVPGFHQCIDTMHAAGAAVLIMLDQPLWTAEANAAEITKNIPVD
jgi:2,4-dienoyl-CoA reductase-like NADH-dependent reductase (Old Yellow Enzyme family)